MGLFHNLSKNNIAVKQQNNGVFPVRAEDVVRPIRKTYETELDRSNDANNKVNINMYFALVTTYCAGAAKYILDGDYQNFANLTKNTVLMSTNLTLLLAQLNLILNKNAKWQKRRLLHSTLCAILQKMGS